MTNVGGNVLLLSLALLASAQAQRECSGPPPEYPHTRLQSRYASRVKFGPREKVYYDCEEDFVPTRGLRAVQCVQGQWTKLTLKCEKRSCGNAGELPNGQFEYEGNSYLGEKVYAVCNEGYTVKGLNYMTCKRTGWTGDFPTCEEGEATTCSGPAVANSVGSDDNAVYQVGDRVTLTCSQGFRLDGAQELTCFPGGQWQPQPPQCLPAPRATQPPVTTPVTVKKDKGLSAAGRCGVPEVSRNANANLATRYIGRTSFASGEKVQYACDVGYVHAGGSRYRMCVEGQWTKLRLTCEPKECGSAGEITNGQFTYTGVSFGDTATAVCDEGYHLVGRGTRTCMSQGWDGRVPICEAMVCEDPPQVANGKIRDYREMPYTYLTVVHYDCLAGTPVGSQEIWCTSDGTWSAPPPTCPGTSCPSPKVHFGYWAGQKNVYQYRETISVECYQGYTLTGNGIITCNRDGQWSPHPPKCQSKMRLISSRYQHAG